MKIFVVYEAHHYEFNVLPTQLISDLKTILFLQTAIPCITQTLLFNSFRVREDALLSSFEGLTLFLL